MMKRTHRNRALPLIAPVFILLLIASHATSPVSATMFPSSAVTINISQQALTLNYHLVLTENLTTLSPTSASLDASNNSSIVKPIIQSIQSAMQKLTPKATVDESQFKLQTSTAEVNPSQGMWAIRLNMTIAVTGVETIESGGAVSYDTDFVSMNMSDPIQVAGLELN